MPMKLAPVAGSVDGFIYGRILIYEQRLAYLETGALPTEGYEAETIEALRELALPTHDGKSAKYWHDAWDKVCTDAEKVIEEKYDAIDALRKANRKGEQLAEAHGQALMRIADLEKPVGPSKGE